MIHPPSPQGAAALSPGTVGTVRWPRAAPLTRLYDAAWLAPDGACLRRCIPAPALPRLEAAFAALARGALVSTPAGPVAVQDLRPGDRVITEAGAEPLVWIGSITLFPAGAVPGAAGPRLVRVTADAFGPGRPSLDLVLGSEAAVAFGPGPRGGRRSAADLADRLTAVAIAPASAVHVYHLAPAAPRLVSVAGLWIASVDPVALGDDADPAAAAAAPALFPMACTRPPMPAAG